MPAAAATLSDRYRGCLLGLACGDAVGTTAEFQSRGSFPPITDMVGGGPFSLRAGKWTDDTSMALCLAESLLNCGGFDPKDQMARYANWWQWGYNSSTGDCFDIGMTVRSALARYLATGEPYAGDTDPQSAGNGSLMRLAPVPMFYRTDLRKVRHFSRESSRTTHGADEAVEACEAFGVLLAMALGGASKQDLLSYSGEELQLPTVKGALGPAVRTKVREDVEGSGYCIRALEAALWCFTHTEDFAAAVLEAANLGDDADTTAAIVGQLAGAHYGAGDIPSSWLYRLHLGDDIASLADALAKAPDAAA